MLLICEQELLSLDLCLGHNKSVCIRAGPRFNADCVKLTTCNGLELEWVNSCRYLGVLFAIGRSFKCSWKRVKPAFTALLTLHSVALVDTLRLKQIIQLLQSKCRPVLLYGLEDCPINSSDYTSLEHPATMAFMKVFKTNSVTVVNECQDAFGFDIVRRQNIKRKINFLVKMCKNINSLRQNMPSMN